MKKVFLSLAIALGLTGAVVAQNAVVTGPVITVDKDVHDYGDVPFGGDGSCSFKVTNTGTEPLIISNCKGSCGCTVPKCDSNPVLPGESSVITVKYDTKRPGPINKSVTVNSNATNEAVKVLRIKGNVGPDPNAAPSGAPEKPAAGAPAGGGN
ncbi:MAG: DUF1573 domain-containing protein [Flavobacteriales bacterium]